MRAIVASKFSRWFAVALLAASSVTIASPRTVELYTEAMGVVPFRRHGAMLYGQYCMQCHGRNAHGDVERIVPALAGQVEEYVVKQLVDFTELDRDAPEMHRLIAQPQLGQPQTWRDLASYLAGLPANEHPQFGNGRRLERGARFFRAYCASCHGVSGEGLAEAAVPALRAQHYSYLLLQLKSFDADRRKNPEGVVLEHMVGLSREDMDAVADYLSRLPAPARQKTVKTPAFLEKQLTSAAEGTR